MNRSHDQIVQANGVELCVDTFGDPTDPAILLIGGTACSMDWWEEAFCERLASDPRFIIRYDHRDTGRSVSYEPAAPQYTLGDLTADALGLLDTLGLATAHVVGMSLGGWIGQLVAIDQPERVASLTLISTRPCSSGPNDPDLPELTDEILAVFTEAAPEPDWSDRTAVIDYIVEGSRPFAAHSRPYDDEGVRQIATRVFDRTANIASSMTNHFMIEGKRWRERLGEVAAPTLVLHGTEDPLFPYGNAEALAAEIPGAQLLALKQTGHEFPRAVWDIAIPAVLRHTAPADGC
ncbi:MAG: alpha/beta fold hydrolase [Gaiellaceae bacterium MAG52_C11]|nr:alpha/beta fold hydrolase [Candidatus Gaiellasilicea maunaloa]